MAVRSVKRPSQVVRPRPPRASTPAPKRNWRALVSRVLCALLALGLGLGLWQLLTSPTFRVSQVDVRGESLLSPAEIGQVTGVVGRSIFAVDRQQVARVVDELGIVRSVEVDLALPNTMTVNLVEYTPVYLWQTGPSAYLVDERGVVLGAAAAGTTLPSVRELETRLYARGDRLNLETLRYAAQLRALWPRALGEIPALELNGAGLTLNGGKWRADLGQPRDLQAKLLALSAVFELGGTARPAYVDLRLPERPFFRMAVAR
ncbi:MAG: cell division protein FtsQ/DivIB [Chloroflexota bacterium]